MDEVEKRKRVRLISLVTQGKLRKVQFTESFSFLCSFSLSVFILNARLIVFSSSLPNLVEKNEVNSLVSSCKNKFHYRSHWYLFYFLLHVFSFFSSVCYPCDFNLLYDLQIVLYFIITGIFLILYIFIFNSSIFSSNFQTRLYLKNKQSSSYNCRFFRNQKLVIFNLYRVSHREPPWSISDKL